MIHFQASIEARYVQRIWDYCNSLGKMELRCVKQIDNKLTLSIPAIEENSLSINNLPFDTIKSNFYHNSGFITSFPLKITSQGQHKIYEEVRDDWGKSFEFVNQLTLESNNKSLGMQNKELSHNKLVALCLAKECGLLIPNTLVTTQKKALQKFFIQHENVILKPIRNVLNLYAQNKYFNSGGTQLLTQKIIDLLDNTFSPCLFQNYIAKETEIRSFFLKGEFFSMAIASQKDSQTTIDYRNYNTEKPNRNIPFKLPNSIESRANELMNKIGLNTGSIDFILTPENEFVFLEVNPTGQFEWLSSNCNYYIEKQIAKKLTA